MALSIGIFAVKMFGFFERSFCFSPDFTFFALAPVLNFVLFSFVVDLIYEALGIFLDFFGIY